MVVQDLECVAFLILLFETIFRDYLGPERFRTLLIMSILGPLVCQSLGAGQCVLSHKAAGALSSQHREAVVYERACSSEFNHSFPCQRCFQPSCANFTLIISKFEKKIMRIK